MKNLKNEKGAITILVLVSVLFMTAFLISSYVIVSNKVQAQKEIVSETKAIYESGKSMEEIYNSYFDSENIIPIYTKEQLLAIGNGEQISVNGKIYNFLNTNQVTYILMDDIEFNSIELELEADWIPFGNNQSFNANFDGNGHKITVTNLDGTEHIYSKNNNFGGNCLLTFNIIPNDAVLTLTVDGAPYGLPLAVVEGATAKYVLELPYNSAVSYTVTKNSVTRQDVIDLIENKTIDINLVENVVATP